MDSLLVARLAPALASSKILLPLRRPGTFRCLQPATHGHAGLSRVSTVTRGGRKVTTAAASFDTVHAAEAGDRLEDGWAYLDVRTEREFSAGHAPSAINIPVMLPTSDGLVLNQTFLAKVHEEFPDKDTPIVVGCKSGKRSEMAANLMHTEGYTKLANLAGGFDNWASSGMPVE